MSATKSNRSTVYVRLSVNEWISKIWTSDTIEYFWIIKRSEVLVHAKHGMNLENTMLGERRQSQEAMQYGFHL